MNVIQLQRTRRLVSPGRLRAQPPLQRPRQEGSFSATLKKAVGHIEAVQKAAYRQAVASVADDQGDLYKAMNAMNQATVSLQLMTEFRNRALESYQELMRMQV